MILVGEKKECDGPKEDVGKKNTLEECAKSCKEISSMFVYGTNEFGLTGCWRGCECQCETSAVSGTCTEIQDKKFLLYKYNDVKTGIWKFKVKILCFGFFLKRF